MKFNKFDPKIYPRTLWVCVGAERPDILAEFDLKAEVALGSEMADGIAQCIPVIQKETGAEGIVCNIINARLLDCGTIGHEAVHVADYMFQETGSVHQPFGETNEPYAYLVGWVAQNIWNAIYANNRR